MSQTAVPFKKTRAKAQLSGVIVRHPQVRTIGATNARKRFYSLIKEISASDDTTLIQCKGHSVRLISEESWNAIQETLFLLSVPDMRQSIVKGLKTPLSQTSKTLKW